MLSSYDIYICGVGGQGNIKTSIILAEAAMNNDLNVVMSEIHGMSQRGGVVSTELRIGYMKSSIIEEEKSDMILAFEPLEALRSLKKMNRNSEVIFNTSPIIPPTISQTGHMYPPVEKIISRLGEYSDNVYPIEAEKLAKQAGHILSLNMVLLGAASAIDTFPLSREVIIESMENNLPPKTLKINHAAFNKGYNSIVELK